jgi:hypothetical protein
LGGEQVDLPSHYYIGAMVAGIRVIILKRPSGRLLISLIKTENQKHYD